MIRVLSYEMPHPSWLEWETCERRQYLCRVRRSCDWSRSLPLSHSRQPVSVVLLAIKLPYTDRKKYTEFERTMKGTWIYIVFKGFPKPPLFLNMWPVSHVTKMNPLSWLNSLVMFWVPSSKIYLNQAFSQTILVLLMCECVYKCLIVCVANNTLPVFPNTLDLMTGEQKQQHVLYERDKCSPWHKTQINLK